MNHKSDPKALIHYEDTLLGAKGITYLMYVGREAYTVDVANLLSRAGIIKNKDVAYVYTNELRKRKYVKTTGTLPRPGPPKRRTANLEPIFNTIGFYRSWKIYPEDQRQLSVEESKKLASFFQTVSPLIDYFPRYLSLHLRLSKKPKLIRTLVWSETLSFFFEFCFVITETCWNMNEHQTLQVQLRKSQHSSVLNEIGLAVREIGLAPRSYIQDAHKNEKLTSQTIAEIARFSLNGHKDIYRDSFLRELYWIFISLRNPLEAGSLARRSEEMLSALLEGQLEDIPVRALYWAIHDRAMRQFEQIEKEVQMKFADHDARDEALQRLLKCKPEDVPKALDAMIKKFKFDVSRDEMKKKLVDVELARLLKGRAEQLELS